ncbi:hypothetical protein SDC9_191644 [bioreactor metagenome]|uniref:Uncharacterized protein n=1 Tax=bioreactor metagenome TaxID=1076179 RepID=A0A645I9I4_9ZZZZ
MNNEDKNWNVNLNSIFGGLNRIFNVAENTAEKDSSEGNIHGDIPPDPGEKLAGKYEFDIKMGTDGSEGFEEEG